MTDPRWTRPAQDDLAGIDDYHAATNPEFAARVGREAIAAARFLAEYPHAGAEVDDVYRRWRVGRTPYLILYQIAAGEVAILRIKHERRGALPL